jgi:predicted kinase
VTAARLANVEVAARETVRRSAQAYFALAQRLIAPRPPILVAVGGLSGTGKSVLARALAPGLAPPPGAVTLRSDVERKSLFGKPEAERLPAEAYAREVTERVYAMLADKARRAVSAGHSAIVDAVFGSPEERAAIAGAASAAGVRFHGLFLIASLETRTARVGTRAADASDADAAIVRQQESYTLGVVAWTLIDANDTPAETLARASAALAGKAD